MNRRPRVLLLAPRYSYRIAPYLRAAKDLDIEVLVASDGRHSVIPALADGLHVDFMELDQVVERIVETARERPLDGVLPTDDFSVELTYRIARALGLHGNDPGAARYSRRKDLARARLRDQGVPAPEFEVMDLDDAAQGRQPALAYPVVAKPLSLAGSRGVIRCDDAGQLARAAARIRDLVRQHPDPETRSCLLLEAYMPGIEVALEGLLQDGSLRMLALFDKPEPLEGPYFEESYYIMPSRLPDALQRRCRDVVQAACDAYGLSTGPVHAELRIDGDRVRVIEVAARTIGGQCARLLRWGAGRGVEELVLAQAIGRELEIKPGEGAGGVLMIPIPEAGVLRRVEGVMAASRVEGIVDVEISVREGAELVPPPDGDAYLGFIFARADTPEQAEAALRAAHRELNIVVGPLFRLRPREAVEGGGCCVS